MAVGGLEISPRLLNRSMDLMFMTPILSRMVTHLGILMVLGDWMALNSTRLLMGMGLIRALTLAMDQVIIHG